MPEPDPIPMLDLSPEIEEHWDELMDAVAEVLRSGQFILGPQVVAFEREVARYLAVDHGVGLNSGTDALVIGLRALGIGPGAEVVTSPFTFFATVEAIGAVGAQPVFADIAPDTFTLDPARVQEVVTGRTRAIVPVHLFGHPADMRAIGAIAAEHGLAVVEDAAQALGAAQGDRKAGTFGAAGAFSFFPSKNLGGFGDGGLLATGDADVAQRARVLRSHGARRKHRSEELGYNSRLDELQAGLLRTKLPRLDAANAARRRVAARYEEALGPLADVVRPPVRAGFTHVFHQYTVRLPADRRDAVAEDLALRGIATAVYYPVPVHRLPPYAGMKVHAPEAERAAREVLSLPIWPTMSDGDIERVAAALSGAVNRPRP